MPSKSSAFVFVVFLMKSCLSCSDEEYQTQDDGFPIAPGCRSFRLEGNLRLSVFCNEFIFPETPSCLPNSTVLLQIYGVSSLDVRRPLFRNLLNLSELQLIKNNLQTVTSRMLEGLSNLRNLSLKTNNIRILSSDTFIHNPLLEKIDLSGNYIISVVGVTHCLGKLLHFQELILADNMIISSLTFQDFEPLQNVPLLSLVMSGCPIDRIDSDAFLPLTNLSVLDLSYTLLDETAIINCTHSLPLSSLKSLKVKHLRYLSSVPFELLWSLENSTVEEIDFSFNRFRNFPSENYSFRHLKFLDLTDCSLYSLQPKAFDKMPNLETLILRRNQISSIQKQFAHLTKLRRIDLSEPTIIEPLSVYTIQDYAFRNLSSLEYIFMEALPLRQGVKRFTFHGLMSLIHLGLSRCGIPKIEEYAFETLHNLEFLDLSDNFMETLDNTTFYGLVNVKTINLGNNAIVFLNRSNPFRHTLALQSLNLNGNKINQLPPGIFDKTPYLGIIRLSKNFIGTWHQRVLSQNACVDYLQISMNRIRYFSPEMLDDLHHIQTLDFSYNPLNCSECGMSDLQAWMRANNTSLHPLDLRDSEYRCDEPQNLANISILDVEFPIKHCIPEEVDALLLSVSIIIPFTACLLLGFIIWFFLQWHIRYCCFKLKARARVYRQVKESNAYRYDAFVSYSPSDILWVRNHLIPELENRDQGCRLCVSDRDFEVAVMVADNLFWAVQNSRSTILVLSNAYLESEWCKFDMNIAQHKLFEDTRSLILILLEEIDSSKMTKNLKYIVKTRTFIPWTNNFVGQKLFWERLRFAVARPNEEVLLKHIT